MSQGVFLASFQKGFRAVRSPGPSRRTLGCLSGSSPHLLVLDCDSAKERDRQSLPLFLRKSCICLFFYDPRLLYRLSIIYRAVSSPDSLLI